MTRRLLLSALLCAAGITAAALLLRPAVREAPAAIAAPRLAVALGRIEPASDAITLAGPQGSRSGRIAQLLVEQGQSVTQGQLLAVMDNAAAMAGQLEQARAAARQREARLAQRLVELDAEEASLVVALSQERASRDRARWEYDRTQRLERGGVLREAALIDRRLALEVAEQKVHSAELALARVRRRDAAGLRLEEAVLLAERDMAAATLAQMEQEAALAMLRAPISGRILRINARPGEVPGNDGVLLLGDTSRMRVRAELFETDLHMVAPGQRVRITSRALPDALAGEVTWIGLRVARQSILREDPAATLDARVVEVMIQLDATGSARVAGLSGMQVRAHFGATP